MFVVLVGLIVALRKADQERTNERLVALETWTKHKESFDYTFRHHEYSTTISRIEAQLLPAVSDIESQERRIDRLERKIFNGAH